MRRGGAPSAERSGPAGEAGGAVSLERLYGCARRGAASRAECKPRLRSATRISLLAAVASATTRSWVIEFSRASAQRRWRQSNVQPALAPGPQGAEPVLSAGGGVTPPDPNPNPPSCKLPLGTRTCVSGSVATPLHAGTIRQSEIAASLNVLRAMILSPMDVDKVGIRREKCSSVPIAPVAHRLTLPEFCIWGIGPAMWLQRTYFVEFVPGRSPASLPLPAEVTP
jgi:hypothetical protein